MESWGDWVARELDSWGGWGAGKLGMESWVAGGLGG